MASLERRVAIDAARAAGQLLKTELSGSRRIAYKGSPTNLVTEMDARVEELIVSRLAAAFPDDAVLAEERGASAGRSGDAGSSTPWTAPPTTRTGFRPSASRSRSSRPGASSSA
jgi:fructose-1,6-bisphosphatase/inositol monophosphatase family enzyme